MSTAPVVLDARALSKRFGPTRALDRFDLSIRAGEVVALMGANGAGKSTVVKILSGVLRADSGTLTLRGRPYQPDSAQRAKALGVATMHQAVADAVVPTLSIAENLLLDRTSSPSRAGGRWFATPSARLRDARAIAAHVGLTGDLAAPLAEQSVATKQLVTLARALDTDPALLILDEPTASLSAAEAHTLFAALDALRARGVGILLVSHRPGDLRRMADRAVVLRDGRHVADFDAPLDGDAALHAMIGRPLPARSTPAAAGGVLDQPVEPSRSGFRARGLKLFPDAPPLDFHAARGEIVAIAGPVGGGKSRLARTIFGIEPPAGGAMTLDGEPWRARSAADAIDAGVFMLGEDRWATSLFPDSVPFASIEGTLSFPFLARWFRGGRIVRSRERARAQAAIRSMTVRCNGPADRVANLSGGNQQKVALARWHLEPARMLLLDEPFQGVDVGARAEIVEVLRRGAADRVTLVFVSDVEEAFEVADRVLHFDRLRIETLD
ncbi:sugar ABC transporter ATP-binding protein [Paraburkholderia caballeronis]|uniref:Monosaccharide ABC transporter ATP-binding protein, CUT2 family n=1 Tax=Paraburkholderia caballeronis TaxID=416943 RepID=A0A1H7FCB0_9BURK|nr:sugar ABC transporter ATP-binding protein [Paraburkholderia caballeronis]PXW24059.1 monosaccharide ABC transporter ATP-binding protein (CUT2 family) [Paraburkholderia caballeronis]PXW99823.1 monosaccharide ABC transporter ATP-binding protein (CUT2 family) [Paraburkholderia caballeronis]RAJ96777.1 monosaccharide ABC transporter ATP-binding protein (CUT2 family) [Paraburkholderia caballeronis]TDV15811.1 monosaccharide ABC transporter ATP-binding protein (CUT2 family) [Paraburkholderia caballer